MKLLPLLALLLLPAPPQDKKNPSEALFLRMLDRLAKAKTLQVKISVRGEGDAEKTTMKGAFLFGEGNKFRTDWTESHGKRTTSDSAVSDGKSVVAWGDRAKAGTPGDTPSWLNRHLLAAFGRAGAGRASSEAKLQASALSNRKKFPPPGAPAEPEAPDATALLKATEFAPAESAQLGGKNCPGITIKTEEHTTTLHLDPRSSLPMQRTVHFKYGTGESKLIETYEGWKLDEKIDDAKFALPEPEKK